MKKLVVFIISLVVLMNCMSLAVFAGDEESEPQEPYVPAPAVEIGNVTVYGGAVTAGDVFTVSFYSRLYDTNGNTTLTPYSAEATVSGGGFTLSGYLAEQDIRPNSTCALSILCDNEVPTGRHSVVLDVKYVYNGVTYSESKTLNIDVVGAETEIVDESDDHANFKLVAASIPETRGRAKLATTLKLSFENTSGYAAENVKVTLSGFGGDIILNTYTDTVEAGRVAGNQTINVSFPIKYADTVMNPQSALNVRVTYDSGPEQNFNIYLQANITKQEEQAPESATLTPKVIVSQYTVDVDNVTSGEEFTLTFVLENTSADKDLRNMTVSVTPLSSNSGSSGPVFSFIDGTSSFYTDILEKSGTLEYSIRLKCSASAGAGSYPINISYKYEYLKDGWYTSDGGEMNINLPVVQPIKFELMEWYPPMECSFDGIDINFQYFNKSRNPMSSLAISVEGDFEMPVQYVGTLGASSYDFFSGYITPAPGAEIGDTKTALLVFTFEDAAGEEQRIEYPFDVVITEGMSWGGDDWGGVDWGGDFGGDFGGDIIGWVDPGMPADGDTVDGEGGGLALWLMIAIPAVLVAIVIVVVVVVAVKVKAKREEDDE